MMTATRLDEFERAWDLDGTAGARGLGTHLVQAAPRRLRRLAFRLLDLRTEFDALAPGEPSAEPLRSPAAEFRLAVARRVRRAASNGLDLWTAFATLD